MDRPLHSYCGVGKGLILAILFLLPNASFAQENGSKLQSSPLIFERTQPDGDIDQIVRRADLVAITETRQVGGGNPALVPYETVCRVIKCARIAEDSKSEMTYVVYKMILDTRSRHSQKYLRRCESFVAQMNQLIQSDEFSYTLYDLDQFQKIENLSDQDEAFDKLEKCSPSIS